MGIRKDILDRTSEAGWSSAVSDVIYRTYRYAERRKLQGACHALSLAMYVALSELGFSPDLCVGECDSNDGMKPFDHSWIVLYGKIIDVAISMPLPPVESFCGIVVGDIDISTGERVDVSYGIRTSVGFVPDTQTVLSLPFVRYMDGFPFERRGLWTVVGRILDKQVNVSELRSKYHDVSRTVVSTGDVRELPLSI